MGFILSVYLITVGSCEPIDVMALLSKGTKAQRETAAYQLYGDVKSGRLASLDVRNASRFLLDREAEVRYWIASALASAEPTQHEPVELFDNILRCATAEKDGQVFLRLMSLLESRKQTSIPTLKAILAAIDIEDYDKAFPLASLAGRIGDHRVVSELCRFLQSKDPQVQCVAANSALGIDRECRPAYQALLTIVKDRDSMFRFEASDGLARSFRANSEIVAVLQNTLFTEEPQSHRWLQAAFALWMIGEVNGKVVNIIEKERVVYEKKGNERFMAVFLAGIELKSKNQSKAQRFLNEHSDVVEEMMKSPEPEFRAVSFYISALVTRKSDPMRLQRLLMDDKSYLCRAVLQKILASQN